jgi:hypothetical protein
MASKALIIDANIVVRDPIEMYAEAVSVPEVER